MTQEDAAYAWLRAFAAALATAGVRDVCICPGSRSTPVALAFARQPALRLWMHLDERSAAYFGLGLAKASRRPPVLICTSGTAAANFTPAVVEAFHAGVPLLVLTADRPPEVRGWGSAQTIAQVHLYGHQVKWFTEAVTQQPGADAVARRAVAVAASPFPGPVHVNIPLREPLLPSPSVSVADPVDVHQSVAGSCAVPGSHGTPFAAAGTRPAPVVADLTPKSAPPRTLQSGTDASLSSPRRPAAAQAPAPSSIEVGALADIERGLIVCGPLEDAAAAGPITRLATALGWPVAADPLSQVRCGPHHGPVILDSYDSYLRDPGIAADLAPEWVLRFGGPPTSKVLGNLIRRARHTVIVDPGWRDPDLAAEVIPLPAPEAARALLAERAPGERPPTRPPTRPRPWLQTWQRCDEAARRAAAPAAPAADVLTEYAVFPQLGDLLPDGSALIAGNSMPVRDMDGFLPGTTKTLRIFANRGANGIDGVVSTGLGVASAGDGPAALVLGDISFYHDMNGLLAAKRYAPRLLIVVIQNDGGGIFSYLPQTSLDPGEYEMLFGTPHGLDVGRAAALYGIPHRQVESVRAFRAAVTGWLSEGGTRIVEVRSDRARSRDAHRAVWAAAQAAVRRCG